MPRLRGRDDGWRDSQSASHLKTQGARTPRNSAASLPHTGHVIRFRNARCFFGRGMHKEVTSPTTSCTVPAITTERCVSPCNGSKKLNPREDLNKASSSTRSKSWEESPTGAEIAASYRVEWEDSSAKYATGTTRELQKSRASALLFLFTHYLLMLHPERT